MDKCPKCGAVEIEAMTPRTMYKCGSSVYDQRPRTFKQSIKCRWMSFSTENVMIYFVIGIFYFFISLLWFVMWPWHRVKYKKFLELVIE